MEKLIVNLPRYIRVFLQVTAMISGIWSAFWMLPYDSEYGTWATSGELDIMEARGRMPNTVCGTIHYGDVWPNNSHDGKDFFFEEGDSFANYHIYSVEWDPTEIRWMVDGEVYGAISNWYSAAGGKDANKNRVASVNVEREAVSLWQLGINLLEKDSYRLTFGADSSEAQNVTVKLTSADDTTEYASQTISLNAGVKEAAGSLPM